MISWIQSTFQRHLKLVFGVLLAVIIVSFVFTIGASPGVGPADQQTIKREFFGYNLNSPEDQQRVMGDAGLSASLQVGYGLEAEQIQNYAFQRVASLEVAKKLACPQQPPAKLRIRSRRSAPSRTMTANSIRSVTRLSGITSRLTHV